MDDYHDSLFIEEVYFFQYWKHTLTNSDQNSHLLNARYTNVYYILYLGICVIL